MRPAICLGLILSLVYLLSPGFAVSNDCRPNLRLAVQILRHGKLSFTPDEAPDMFVWKARTPKGETLVKVDHWAQDFNGRTTGQLRADGVLTLHEPYYYLVPSRRPGEFVSMFGFGAALTALPVIAPLLVAGVNLEANPWILWYAGKLVGSLLVSATSVVLFLAAAQRISRRWALLLAMAYALGTCVWSTSSQSLWQHGPVSFFLAIGFYFLLRLSEQPPQRRHAAACGASLGMAVLCRPDASVFVVAVGVWLLLTHRRLLPPFILAGLPFAISWGVYNGYFLESPLEVSQSVAGLRIAQHKTGSSDIWQTPLHVGLPGVLISPSRGLFVFSPFLLFALWGMARAWSDRRWSFLRPLSLAVLTSWIISAKFFDWWSGWSYGYRHIVDTTTALVLFLIPIVDQFSRNRTLKLTFAVLLFWSIGVQVIGVTAFDVAGWNNRTASLVQVPGEPEPRVVLDSAEAGLLVQRDGAKKLRDVQLDVDQPAYRHRLWSIRDSQILYYVSHFQQCRRTREDLIRHWAGH